MFDTLLDLGLLPLLATGTSVAALAGGLMLLRLQAPDKDDAWRDPLPWLFRLARPLVNLFAHRVAKSMDAQVATVLGERLGAAGLAYTIRPEEFLVAQRLGFVIGSLVFAGGYLLVAPDGIVLYLLMSFPAAGYFFPRIWLRDMTARRRAAFEKQFPFFLDLLVLSVRAGLNFSSGLAQAVAKMTEGPVRTEFARVMRELRTGVPRREALKDLGSRLKLPAVTGFVAAVNQAEETGGEIGTILLAQAGQRRSERFLKAEKLANQAPVKMLLPLVALLFPISLIIIMFPLFIRARDSGAIEMLFR